MPAPLKQDIIIDVKGLQEIQRLESSLIGLDKRLKKINKRGIKGNVAKLQRETAAIKQKTAAVKQDSAASQVSQRHKEREIALGYKAQQQVLRDAASKNTAIQKTNALSRALRRLRDKFGQVTKSAGASGKAVRAFAGGAAVAGGTLRTQISGAAFHSKSFGLLGLFATIAAIRAYFTGVIGAAAKFEKQMALVAKTTKMNREETKEYGAELLKLSSRLAIARGELAKISIIAGQMGIRGQQNLLEFTETIGLMTRVSEISAQKAADGIASISVAFDLPIDAAVRMGSSLNELGNNTTANASKIIRAINKVGAGANALGLTFEETAATGATLIHGGIDPSAAGTALKTGFIRLRTEAEAAARVMGITVREYNKILEENPLPTFRELLRSIGELDLGEQAQAINLIFGKRHATAMQILIDKQELYTKNLEISNEAFAEGTSLMHEQARASDNLAVAWERWTGGLSNWFAGKGTRQTGMWQTICRGYESPASWFSEGDLLLRMEDARDGIQGP